MVFFNCEKGLEAHLLLLPQSQVHMYTPGDMLNGVLKENQLGFLGEGHVVIIEVVLENSLNLIHVCQILIQTVFFLCSHLQGNVVRYFRINIEIESFLNL